MVQNETGFNKEAYFGFNPDKVTPDQVMELWQNEQKTWGGEQPLTIFLSPVAETMALNNNLLVDRIRTFPDGSTTPHFSEVTAKAVYNRNIVLITSMGGNGSAKDKDVRTAARYYKAFGAKNILLEATKLLDSRQDRHFPNEAPTLFSVIKGFSDDRMPDGSRVIDGMVLSDNHSSLLFKMAGGLKFPITGLTGYRFMIKRSGLVERISVVGYEKFAQMAPDANRHKTANSSAQELGIEVVSCDKKRDTQTGDLIMLNEFEVIEKLKSKTDVVVFDDEVATVETIKLLMDAAEKANPNMRATVLAMHNNCSVTALDNFRHPLIKKILITDTMMPPLTRQGKEKLRALPLKIIPVGDSLIKVGEYLMTGGGLDNLPDDWQVDPWLQSAA